MTECAIKKGDLLCDLHYFTVSDINETGAYFKDVSTGEEWSVPIKFVNSAIKDAWSAESFKKEEKLCRSEVVRRLLDAGVRPFTVEFIKADGEDRKLRGTFLKGEPTLGRSIVKDLDLSEDNVRLVDHRTIKSLIIDNIKYIVESN